MRIGLGPAKGKDTASTLGPYLVTSDELRPYSQGDRFDLTMSVSVALDLTDGELGGIVAWWSILHTPPEVLPVVFAEFRRTLAPGGHLLAGFHAGDEHRRPEHAYGHPVSYDTYLLPPDRITELLSQAGMVVIARLLSDGKKWPQACLLAHKPRTERVT
jgi:hypothetical protein